MRLKNWRWLGVAGAVTSLLTAGLIAGTTAGADPVASNTNAPVGVRPMMGFNDWARFECSAQPRLDGTTAGYSFQQFMQDQGAAMKSLGLVSAGYTNVTVDDCWMDARNSSGYLHGAPTWGGSSQPGFDYELTDYANYLHSQGELAGVYNTSGATTCQGKQAGAQGYQQNDANSYAYWGIDSLKLDNCGVTGGASAQSLFTAMSSALNTATSSNSRKILFNESAPAGYSNGSSAKYSTMDWVRSLGQMWRTGPDIKTYPLNGNGWNYYSSAAYEEGAYQSFLDTVQLARYMAPGDINDPDQLLIGDNGLTVQEERSQFALWSAMGAPLVISTDLRKLAANPTDPHYAQSIATLKNSSIIAVDQDSLGAGGYLADGTSSSASSGFDVVVKPLADGSRAVVILNKNSATATYNLDLGRVGFGNLGCARTATNLWSHTNSSVTNQISVSVAAHDNAMYTIAPGSCGAALPTGRIADAQTGSAAAPLCLDAWGGGSTAGTAVGLYTCGGTGNQQWVRNSDSTISLYGTRQCLSRTAAGSTSSINGATGTFAVLATCNASDTNQKITYHRSGTLAANGLCLDVYGSSTGSNGPADWYGCGTNQVNQLFAAPFSTPPAA